MLLERGANIGLKNNWDETPIAKAIYFYPMKMFLGKWPIDSEDPLSLISLKPKRFVPMRRDAGSC